MNISQKKMQTLLSQSAFKFFEVLYHTSSELPKDSWLVLWHPSNNRSQWFQDITKAAEYAASYEKDIYFGVNLMPDPATIGDQAKPIYSKRGKATDVQYAAALYVDIDVKGGNHKKGNLPPTMDDARNLINMEGLKPTITNITGHGIHAYWVFDQLIDIKNNEKKREFISTLNKRMHNLIKIRAEKKGWTIDSVFNLDRILRIPGTLNCKNPKNVMQVKLDECSEITYNIDQLDKLLPKLPPQQTKLSVTSDNNEVKKVSNDLILDPDAEPPEEKFNELFTVNPAFKETWLMQREDFIDDSPSAYDFSLTNFAVNDGWTDQEIADLIIAFRRKHGHDIKKALRQKYIPITITKVRKDKKKQEADDIISNQEGVILNSTYKDNATIKKVRDSVSTMIGVDIKEIIKFNTEPPSYLLVTTDNKKVELPASRYLIKSYLFQEKLADIGIYMKVNKRKWPKCAEKLLELCIERDVGEEGTHTGQIKSWLQEYCEEYGISDSQDDPTQYKEVAGEFDKFGLPIMRDNQWHIHIDHFKAFLIIDKHDATASLNQLRQRLSQIDAKPIKFNFKKNEETGKRPQKRMWQLPYDITKEYTPKFQGKEVVDGN